MAGQAGRQHHNVTLGVLALAALAFALLQTMVAPALPAIREELGASTTAVTWVITIYLLSASVATPILGRLGDMFGKERVLVAVLVAFAAGNLVAALSHSLTGLILGRAIQGAAGAVFPLAFGIIRDEFPRERVATGIGLISATFGIGGGAGVVLSGVIVDNLSYEWIFWLGLAITVVAIVTTRLFVPESPVKNPGPIDWAGALLLSAALVSLLIGVSQGNSWGWSSPGVVGLFAAAAVLLVWWARFEARQPAPMVDMALLRRRGVWTTNLTAVLIGFGMFASFILIPAFVQTPESAGYGFGATVTQAGLFLLPASLVMLVAGPLSGALATRHGGRLPLMIGTAVAGAAFLLLAVSHEKAWQLIVQNAFIGLGIGMAFAAMANLVVQAAPQNQTGEATGMNTIMRTIGGALGAQVAAAILADHVAAGARLPSATGYTVAFGIGAAGFVVALAVAALIPGPRRPMPVHRTVPAAAAAD